MNNEQGIMNCEGHSCGVPSGSSRNPGFIVSVKMKNRISQHFLRLIVLMLIAFSLSCDKDDVIVNPPNDPQILDSNFFDWQYIEINGANIGSTMFIADTNKVFIEGFPYSLYYNNGVFQKIYYNDPDFISYTVNGVDKNFILFGGSTEYPKMNSKLKVWKDNTIINIQMPNDSSQGISYILPISVNELWMATQSNIIYHYFNNVIYTHKIDSGFKGGYLSYDSYGNLYSFSKKYLNFSDFVLNVSKFENNNWISLLSDTLTQNSELSMMIGKINSTPFRRGKDGVYYFSIISCIKLFSTYGELESNHIGGSNLNNLLLFGWTAIHPNVYLKILYYDGKHLYRQNNHIFPEDQYYVTFITNKFGRFYLLYSSDEPHYYFSIAIPKKPKIKK